MMVQDVQLKVGAFAEEISNLYFIKQKAVKYMLDLFWKEYEANAERFAGEVALKLPEEKKNWRHSMMESRKVVHTGAVAGVVKFETTNDWAVLKERLEANMDATWMQMQYEHHRKAIGARKRDYEAMMRKDMEEHNGAKQWKKC